MIVKAVDVNVEEKSRAQVEETLLKEHEEQYKDSSDGIERIDFRNKENSSTTETIVDEGKTDETKKENTDVGEGVVKISENINVFNGCPSSGLS